MNGRKVILKFLFLLLSLLLLAGCKESAKETDKAVAEAEKAKTESARVKAVLRQTQIERDELEKNIAEISAELENARSQFAAVMQTQEELQNQVNGLIIQRDAALAKAREAQAMVEELTNQLNEKTKEIEELEVWSKEMMATLQQLQGQTEKTGEHATEKPHEEPNE